MTSLEIIKELIEDKLSTLVFRYEEQYQVLDSGGFFTFNLNHYPVYGDVFLSISGDTGYTQVSSENELTSDKTFYVDNDTGLVKIYTTSPIANNTATVSYWSHRAYNNYLTNEANIKKKICMAASIVNIEDGIEVTTTTLTGDGCDVEEANNDTEVIWLVAYKASILLMRSWLIDLLKSGGVVNLTTGRLRVNTTSIPTVVDAIVSDWKEAYNRVIYSLYATEGRELAGLA